MLRPLFLCITLIVLSVSFPPLCLHVNITDVAETPLNQNSFPVLKSSDNNITQTLPEVSLGYIYSMDVTLNAASGSEDLTDFPALISFTNSSLSTTTNGGHVFNSSGYDIIFTDQDANKLDHQIELYDPTTGEYVAWVRIPVLSNTSSTTIRMLYGNPAVSTNPSVKTVWKSSYKGVWHLNGTDYTDATVNSNNGTNSNTTNVTGKIAGAGGFNGTNSYIQVPTNGLVPNNNNQTISIWAYYTVAPSGNRNLISFQNAGAGSAIQLGFRGGNAVAWKWEGEILVNGGASPSVSNWHYYVYTYDGTTSRYYIDGVLVASSSVAPQTAMPTEGNIGRYNNGEYIAASLDEPRFSMSPKSAGWILTEYNNQNDPSSFISSGSEELNEYLVSAGVCQTSYLLDSGWPSGGIYSGPGVSGTNFNPSEAGPGTHSISYTYTDTLGYSNSATKFITVTPAPASPSASDVDCCVTNIADLVASGTNLTWYSDEALTTVAGTGSPFATGRTAAGTYTYYVTQTVNGCESEATVVSLNVYNGITINTHPAPETICDGNNAIFEVVASGYNLTYQWQENGVNITEGGIYSGTTTSVLTLLDPGITYSGRSYRCVVSSPCGASPLTSNFAACTIILNNIWTGAVSTDWNDPGNWSCGLIPVSTSVVQIPDLPNKPIISIGAAALVNDLTVESGSSLTVSGNTIRISGSISGNSNIDASFGTIELNGSSAQIIGPDIFTDNLVMNLIVNNSSGVSLTGVLNISGVLTVTAGTIVSDGHLTLLSTPAQTALIDGSGSGEVTGNVTMQRYLSSGFGYKYISSPFSNATINELGDDMDLTYWFPSLYRYDESRTTSGWVDYTNPDGLMSPLHGYAANFGESSEAKTFDITGVVNNGDLSITFYNHDNLYTKGFNLTGNPYPSPIDWDSPSGWTRINIDDAIYYFKASTTDSYGGTYSTYMDGISSDGVATSIIPSMQGFFIHVANGTYPVTGTLGMTNEVRITDHDHPFIKSDSKSEKSFLRLEAGYSNDLLSFDPLVIYFDIKATNNFDGQLDALKLYNTDYSVTNFYSFGEDGKRLSINALPLNNEELCTVRLGIKTEFDGEVIFKIRDIVGDFLYKEITISDVVMETKQDLLDNKIYKVFLPAGHYQDRFILNLSNTPTGISDPTDQAEHVIIYSYDGILKTKINLPWFRDGMLTIFNLSGQALYKYKINSPGEYEFIPALRDGLYIISLISGSRKVSKKVVFQNR